MNESVIILYIIKLVLYGIAAFLAIALWSKTRDGAWMCIVSGTIVIYAGVVYSMLEDFGIIPSNYYPVFGIPLFSLVFVVLPVLFFIIAFILMLSRNRG